MDQVTKVRQHFKREEGKSIISECRASGMTVKAWCQTHRHFNIDAEDEIV